MNGSEQIEVSVAPRAASSAWRWPLFGYSLVFGIAAALFMPPGAGQSILNIWDLLGALILPFALVTFYLIRCAILLATKRFTTVQAERLVIIKHIAYASGVLGVVRKLVGLAHGSDSGFDPAMVFNCLQPFEIGFGLWSLTEALRLVAEHIKSQGKVEVGYER